MSLYDSILYTDVLVVGGGLAGMRSALAAASNEVDVTVVVKGKKFITGSSFYPMVNTFGFQAVSPDQGDAGLDEHYAEILNAGQGMCIPKLSQILVQEAYANIKFLKDIDAGIYPVKNIFGESKPCFSKRIRTFRLKNLTRYSNALQSSIKKSNINIIDRTSIISLLAKDNECHGAVAMNRKSGEIMVIFASSTILACGGGSSVFLHNLNSPELVGDGYRLSIDAGASLLNLEFIQFIYGICKPTRFVFHQAAFKYGAIPRNEVNEDFIEKWLPASIRYKHLAQQRAKHGPFTSRMITKHFDHAIYKEIVSGPNNRLFSVNIMMEDIRNYEYDKRFSQWINYLKVRKGHIFEEKIRIAQHAHACNGGILINENTESQVRGLFAAGELAAGPHGADRLGGNMMTAALVFGNRAGIFSAKRAKRLRGRKLDNSILKNAENMIERQGRFYSNNLHKNLKKLAELMWIYAGIMRTYEGLKIVEQKIFEIEKNNDENRSTFNPKKIWRSVEQQNRILTSKIIIQSALKRKESRGSHYRQDYPEINNLIYNKILLINKKDDKIICSFRKTSDNSIISA